VSTPTHGFHEIRFNMEMAPTDHPVLRQALQHATDRAGLLKSVFGGAGTISNNSLITPAFPSWNNPDIPVPKFDIALARKILADAGFTWDAEGRLIYPAA
ncbi:MAG: ABC transporter substrate-binding protein, partial [Solimonas sp.]